MAVKLSDLARAGDKIDIKTPRGKAEENPPYKSNVSEVLSDEEIEITIPTSGGKIVYFHTGNRCNMLIYTKRGVYTCEGVVSRCYKKENIYLMSVTLTAPPLKLQRREFFRINCMMELKYYRIPAGVAELKTTHDLHKEVLKPMYVHGMGTALDISGGGLRFISGDQFEEGSYLLVVFRLTDERIDQTFYLVTQIVASDPSPNKRGNYVSRSQFLFKDLRDRETIVRYVFEEERRMRKKELG